MPHPAALASDGTGLFERPLTRMLGPTGAHFALLYRRKRDDRALTLVAAVAAPGFDIDTLADHGALFAMAAHDRQVLSDDTRAIARSLQRPSMANLVLVAARVPDAAPFRDADIAAFTERSEWIEDVAELWWLNRRTEARLEGVRAGFGTRDTAAILLDGEGCILETNVAARRMLRARTGLQRVGDRLTASHPDDAARLREAWFEAIAAYATGRRAPPRELTIARDPGQRPLLVAVHQPPTAALREGRHDPRLLLLIVDPDASRDIDSACAVYHLTQSQTRLTKKLVEGLSVTEAAAELGLSAETGRTYLKEIFRRTGVSRQTALIRLLLSSCLPVTGSVRRPLPARRAAKTVAVYPVRAGT